ncbi:MAG: hypothetical protein ACLPUT_05915 [Solirubrobacteraceae bacterium]
MSVQPYAPAIAARLEQLGAALSACCAAGRGLQEDHAWRAAAGSPAERDIIALERHQPAYPAGTAVAIAAPVNMYFIAAHEDLGGLGALYRAHHVTYPPGKLLRAVIEYCSRMLWILQHDDQPVENRLARAMLEALWSAEQAQKAAKHLEGKDSDAYRAEAAIFKQTRASTEEIFGAPIVDENHRHKLRGIYLPGLEDGVAWMFHEYLGVSDSKNGAKGIYDVFCALTHPVLYPMLQMWQDGNWSPLPEHRERRVAAAIVPFYNTMSSVISYFGWPTTRLDQLTAVLDELVPGLVSP